ncbi:type IV toxin-antitoxin system AbiEi family antitoxin [Pseudanabaena mucicola]|uniref:type IV toxin-antitoxin system AbiEi family antitoxin n=1 Tax=Pseudanabaena mucicola TaxID=71190 RepID=UPI0025766846|nr:type IV toxin-antitoxin system AbiEi family antitoxin [Pseudanabaena mucicola]
MRPKNPLFQKCIAHLEALPNLKVEATIQDEPYFSSEVLADGELIISTSNKTANYICEIKTGITNDIVEQVAEYFVNLRKRLNDKQRPLLVTRNLSSLVVDQLIERSIEFIDVDGSVYLNSPEMYIVIRNQFSRDSPNKSLELTANALEVMYFILKHPSIIMLEGIEEKINHWSGNRLTQKTVKITLEKLQKLDYIKRNSKGYEIVDYIKFLERWEIGYAERLRAKLLIGTFRAIGKRDFHEIEDELKQYSHKYEYRLGGELAASIMTQYLRPVGAIIYINEDRYLPLAVDLKLKPDPDGNIEIHQEIDRQNFQHIHNGELNNLIHPLLIHAELVRTGDSRLKETAQLIFDKYIEEIAQR